MKLIEKISIWSLQIIIISIFVGAVLYVAEQMKVPGLEIKEILFWSALLLLFLKQIQRGLTLKSSYAKSEEDGK